MSNIISFPFKLKILYIYKSYNLTNFFHDYFTKNLFLELNIGTPPKKINSILNLNTSCFLFKKDDSNNNNNIFCPNKSSSFKINDKPNEFTNLKTANDIFNFKEINKNNNRLSFLLSNNKNLLDMNYLPIIGLSYPFVNIGRATLYPCPNFVCDLKQRNIIKKMIWTIKYNNKYDGEFIIGEELSGYNSTKYPKSQYRKTYYNSQILIYFESIYIENKNDKIYYISNKGLRDAYININSGVIIGTKEYKNYIDKNFFNELINKKICNIGIITKKVDYYIYSCNMEFAGEEGQKSSSINYYNEFPSLIFSSKKLEYDFELKNKDLFEKISDKYYFLVIFQKNNIQNDKEPWYLGEPFYKKYTFSINVDEKTIGFYLYKKKSNNEIDKTNIVDKKNDTNNNFEEMQNNKNINKILKIIIEIIIIIILLFIAYYIGVTVRERRRKRANELKDDNYEYIPEKNKDINQITNDLKKQKFLELNSHLGL